MSWALFIGGIMAGLLVVYVLYMTLKNIDNIYYEEDTHVTEINIPEETHEVHYMTAEQMDAWYNSMMEIFKAKE